jgi:hypothetical protein
LELEVLDRKSTKTFIHQAIKAKFPPLRAAGQFQGALLLLSALKSSAASCASSTVPKASSKSNKSSATEGDTASLVEHSQSTKSSTVSLIDIPATEGLPVLDSARSEKSNSDATSVSSVRELAAAGDSAEPSLPMKERSVSPVKESEPFQKKKLRRPAPEHHQLVVPQGGKYYGELLSLNSGMAPSPVTALEVSSALGGTIKRERALPVSSDYNKIKLNRNTNSKSPQWCQKF